MSKTFFTENAFNVLGLDSDSSEKEILKRARDITNLIKIDVTPSYDSDLPSSRISRTELKVRNAAEALTVQDSKIVQTYFWFFVKDNTDERALRLFKEGDNLEALRVLQNKITISPNGFTAIRNKAVIESLIFSEKAQTKYLEASLKSWQAIIKSEKQWSDFKKIYKLNNPDLSEAVFNDFKEKAAKILSGFYESMSRAEKNPEIFAAFSKYFSTHSDSFDKDTLDPLLTQLSEITNQLEKYDVTFDDGIYEDGKCANVNSRKKLKQWMDESQEITDKIEALGKTVWESSKVRVVRNKNALALRSQAVDIANNSDLVKHTSDRKLANDLLDAAYDICASNSQVETRIRQDQEALGEINAIAKYNTQMKMISSYIKEDRFAMAIAVIDELLEKDDLPDDNKDDLRELRKKCSNLANIVKLSRPSYEQNRYDNSHQYQRHQTYQTNNTKKKTSGWGWLVFIIIVIIFIVIIVNAALESGDVNKVKSTCTSYGIKSYSCRTSQAKYNVTCSQTSSGVINCKKN